MPKKIQDCTRAHLISVPLPNHAATYTVISHQFVIDYSFQTLANAGFGIVEEEYRCTADGQIAQGIYKLQYNNDPDLSMMFAWTNSYNKQVKFKCLIGAYINQTGTVMTSGDIGTWTRKHIGTADVETKATIDDQVTNAHMYYNQLIADKSIMIGINLNKRKQAQLLGVLFAEYQILTTEQASIIRSQMDRPSHVYEDSNSLWAFYNYVTIALQHSHPRTWMEDQRILHYFISTVGNFKAAPQPVTAPVIVLGTPVEEEVDPLYVIPNQTNLLDQIAEVETQNDDTYDDTSDENDDTSIEVTDNQVVQNGSDFDIDLHQSEEKEIIDLDEEEDKDWEKLEVAGIITPCAVDDVEAEKEETELVQYTDPAGNTFELPMIKESEIPQEIMDALMNAPEMDVSKVDMSKVTWVDAPVPTLEPTPEEHALFEAEEALYVVPLEEEPEANLDLKEAVVEVKEDNSSDFDLDFGSSDPEDDEVDNTPDFF